MGKDIKMFKNKLLAVRCPDPTPTGLSIESKNSDTILMEVFRVGQDAKEIIHVGDIIAVERARRLQLKINGKDYTILNSDEVFGIVYDVEELGKI